ncbi:hypothetical protein EC957_011280, partial [Mortierella hygrophila]
MALDYSPNGQQLALGTGTSIILWDMQSDEPSLELKVLSSSSQHVPYDSVAVAYSPCGQFLVSTFDDYTAHLWRRRSVEGDIDSWSYELALRGCHGLIGSLSWNPVVPLEFIIASLDGSVRVWRVTSDDGTVAVTMRWGTNLRRLCIAGVVLEGVTNLSPTHQKLISQHQDFDQGISKDDGVSTNNGSSSSDDDGFEDDDESDDGLEDDESDDGLDDGESDDGLEDD